MFTIRTMHPSSTSETQQVIVSGIIRNCGRHQQTMDCRTRSNKFGVLVVSAEATTKSSTVATGVSCTSDFRWFKRKKSKGLRSGECGGQATGPPLAL
ncbi:hypothetical protein TNCV_496321 [Trichonephila clavipes]|nr:hypothetical protein TNCV_496321 [Trichonephila clavipes]